MAPGKTWTRRLALAGGAALAAGGASLVLRRPAGETRHRVTDAATFLRGNTAEPETMDPNLCLGSQDDAIVGDLMMGLMTEDALCRPIRGLAEKWTTSPDGLTWTFTLREALWSDGVPVTAEDFIFSWQRILEPALGAPYAYFIYFLKNAAAINAGKMPKTALGARAINSKTLEMSLEHPIPYMLELLMHSATFPLPRHVVTAKGKDWARPGNYVSNGAYTLKRWIPNEYVLAEKNPRFFDAANVALEKIYYYPTADYSAALQRMRAGELDVQDRVPVQRIDWIKANLPQIYKPIPVLVTEYVCVNHTRQPFGDIRVREAINLALNREIIAQRIRRVGDVPAYALVPPGTANYPTGIELGFKSMSQPARLERAQALMRSAGFGEKNRLQTTFMIRSTAPGPYRSVAAAIQQMLSLAYIDITILPTDFQVYLAQTHVHDFNMYEGAWSADFNDAATFLELLQTGGGNNNGLYSNASFDAMLAAAQRDTDLASRGRKLAEAESLALKDHAIMPLYNWASPNIVWPYVKGWHENPMDKHRARWITIDQAARIKQFA